MYHAPLIGLAKCARRASIKTVVFDVFSFLYVFQFLGRKNNYKNHQTRSKSLTTISNSLKHFKIIKHISKPLTNLSKSFDKISTEANALQQRMGALYEDMGNILGRYYDMSETHVYGHDTDDEMTPEKEDDSETKFTIEQGDYEEFFQSAMKKFGIKSPADLDDDEKKKFFNYVDKNFKAKKETD